MPVPPGTRSKATSRVTTLAAAWTAALAAALTVPLAAVVPTADAAAPKRPDLVVVQASTTATTVAEGARLTVRHAVRNQGRVAARATTTRFYLSTDLARSLADRRQSRTNPRTSVRDVLLTGARAVPAVGAGRTSALQTTKVTVPVGTPAGRYTVLVCSDDTGAVTESDEADNCAPAAKPVSVQAAPGSSDLRLQSFAETYRWPDDEDDAVGWMSIFCQSNYPVTPMSLSQALTSARKRLSSTAGADAVAMVDSSPLAQTSVGAQQLAAAAVIKESPGLAMAALLRAHRLRPQDAGNLVNAAALATSIGLPNEAIAFLDAAAVRPYARPALGISQQAIAMTVRGQALLMTGRTSAAAAMFTAAKAREPMLSEADAGLANVKACTGDKPMTARYVRASRQRSQEPDPTPPTGPEDRPDPVIDVSQGVSTPLRQLPLAATPAQGVTMNDVYKSIQHTISGEVTAHVAEETALQAHLRATDDARTDAEKERRDSILVAIYDVHEAPDLEATWRKAMDQVDAITEQREAFFGGGTGEAPYTYGTLADDAWDACAGSDDPHCWIKTMNQTCRPALTSAHQELVSRVSQLQGTLDGYFATYSKRASGYAANLLDEEANRLGLLTVEEEESALYAHLVNSMQAWTHLENLYADECVTPLDAEALDPPAAAEAGTDGNCPAALKAGSFVLSAGPTSLKVNCEQVQQELSTEVLPLVSAFVEVTYDFRAGTLTVVAGGKGGGKVGDVVEAGFKSGLYLTMDTKSGGLKDVGWRVGPSATVGHGPVEVGVYNDEMDLSFVPAPPAG
ncbi:CARDB domain-containing protein [Nocardioides sp.]|uniref:CARDB domain-containing protein n=1 Tax=Nocardioides sp. TaxID=35761 RepID=UPI0037832112